MGHSAFILLLVIFMVHAVREIIAAQEDLRGRSHFTCTARCNRVDLDTAMLAKAKGVQADVDKLVSGNETLQMYIDNLTMQMAKRR